MIGLKFGRLTAVEDVGRSKDRCILYLCQCDCGNTKVIKSKTLKSGESTSCGCYAKEARRNALHTVKVGQKFGRLKILKYIDSNGKKASLWECKCDCGNVILATTNHLTTRNTRSCGCLHKDSVLKGDNHPFWDFSKTTAERILRRKYDDYVTWRKFIFERDNFRCVSCGKQGNINAHHIVNYSLNISLRLAYSNGITLCKECHMSFHKKYGYRNNNQQQLQEFLGVNINESDSRKV